MIKSTGPRSEFYPLSTGGLCDHGRNHGYYTTLDGAKSARQRIGERFAGYAVDTISTEIFDIDGNPVDPPPSWSREWPKEAGFYPYRADDGLFVVEIRPFVHEEFSVGYITQGSQIYQDRFDGEFWSVAIAMPPMEGVKS